MTASEKPDGRNFPIDRSDQVPLSHPKYKMTITSDPEKLKFLYSAIVRVFSQPRALGLLSPPTVEEVEDLLLSPAAKKLAAASPPGKPEIPRTG
jgi:hypothetical protein